MDTFQDIFFNSQGVPERIATMCGVAVPTARKKKFDFVRKIQQQGKDIAWRFKEGKFIPIGFVGDTVIDAQEAPSFPEYSNHTLIEPGEEYTVKFAAIADTHIGSKSQRLDWLYDFYEYASNNGVRHFLHAGDVITGLYPQRIFDAFLHAGDDFVNYTVEHYPHIPGCETILIAGNHDETFIRVAGMDIMHQICEKRKDMKYIGMMEGTVDLGGCRILLQHGDGGMTTSVSNKLQKYIDKLPISHRPHCIILGHYHSASIFLPNFKGVVGIMPGCFEGQTLFLKKKKITPVNSGMIIELTIKDDKLIRAKSEVRRYS